jgi:hypothetical protein
MLPIQGLLDILALSVLEMCHAHWIWYLCFMTYYGYIYWYDECWDKKIMNI